MTVRDPLLVVDMKTRPTSKTRETKETFQPSPENPWKSASLDTQFTLHYSAFTTKPSVTRWTCDTGQSAKIKTFD